MDVRTAAIVYHGVGSVRHHKRGAERGLGVRDADLRASAHWVPFESWQWLRLHLPWS